MKRSGFILLLCLPFAAIANRCTPLGDSSIVGTWTGTSICQVKSSPCNDEIAVYHVSKGDKPNTFHFLMNKMVNGQEEEMGVTDYTFDTSTGVLTSIDEKRSIIWKFLVKKDSLEGELVYKNVLYRIIKLKKTSPGN